MKVREVGAAKVAHKNLWAFIWGSIVAILGGLIGLGGAEFRLPILVSFFKYGTLQSVVINLMVSLVTVLFSFIFRGGVVGFAAVLAHSSVILNILMGSLLGAYMGVNYATRINERVLHRIVVGFLICLSAVLVGHHFIFSLGSLALPSAVKVVAGFIAGGVIGIFSGMLGVAGGELIIPTIILIFSVDIRLAGSLSLAISIPTIMMGLLKYGRNNCFQEVEGEQYTLGFMAIGSMVGALIGSYLLRFVPGDVLYLILGMILLTSALKMAQHSHAENTGEGD